MNLCIYEIRSTLINIILSLATPLGTLPVLNYNGIEIGQSISIARFLAKEFGLAGKDRIEEAKADMVVDCMVDSQGGFTASLHAPEDKKAELQANFEKEILPAGSEWN